MYEQEHRYIWKAIERLEKRMERMEASLQGQIDAIATELDAVGTTLSVLSSDLIDAQTTLQAEIDSLASQGVNIANLQAAADKLGPAAQSADTMVQTLKTLTPTPPPPPPAA